MRLVRLFAATLCIGIIWSAVPSAADTLTRTQRLISRDGDTLVRLTNLNHHIDRWYLLEIRSDFRYQQKSISENAVQSPVGSVGRLSEDSVFRQSQRQEMISYHLETRSNDQTLLLTRRGLKLGSKVNPLNTRQCELWNETFDIRHIDYSTHAHPFFSICQGSVYVRLRKKSNTKLSLTEWGTKILRKTAFGEDLINTMKPLLVNLAGETSGLHPEAFSVNTQSTSSNPHKPRRVLRRGTRSVFEHKLGIQLRQDPAVGVSLGRWYPVTMHKNVFVSLFTPDLVPSRIIRKHQDKVFEITEAEQDKLVYVTAYDLDHYSIKYSVGTEQPPIDSTSAHSRHNRMVVPVGHIPPYELESSIGVFIGGFKQRHSTIKYGPHEGKTYGYIQNGVELRKMAPGLATLLALKDGTIRIERWPENLDQQLQLRKKVVSARQNGAMLLEQGVPGPLVNNWKHGNWSADAKGVRTSLRAGVCLQSKENRQYLIYMAFTSATPSSMARVMQAYRCDNAMHLDMNAYIYMHNALFKIEDGNHLTVEYLNKEMHYPPGTQWHRFIVDNNPRDFFYVTKKKKSDLPVAKSKQLNTPLKVWE